MGVALLVYVAWLLVLLLLLLTRFEIIDGRFALRHRGRFDACPQSVCPAARSGVCRADSLRFMAADSLAHRDDEFPTTSGDDRNDCSYRCRLSAGDVWNCLIARSANNDGSNRDDDGNIVWIFINGDSILRQVFFDLIELVSGKETQDVRDLESLCLAHKTVLGKNKCVKFDLWFRNVPLLNGNGGAAKGTFRLTYVAKHSIGDSITDNAFDFTAGGSSLRPSIVAIDSALWDILYEKNFTDYRHSFPQVLQALDAALGDSSDTRVVWFAAPSLDVPSLPDWKQPILTNAAIREYNAFARRVINERNGLPANSKRFVVRWLDANALTDVAQSTRWRGTIASSSNEAREQLFRTRDGIHRPGPVSKTLTQLLLDISCRRC